MPCLRWWSRPVRPVTQASAPVSTGATSRRPCHTRPCPLWSALCARARKSARRAPTRSSCSTIQGGSARRWRRRPRRWLAPRARRPTSAPPKRPPTCSITCWCSCTAGAWPCPMRRACSMSVAGSAAPPQAPTDAHNLIPLQETFIADCETPVSAFLKLRELAPGEPAFLLESAEQGQRMGRYSFIGFRPRAVLRWSLGDPGDPYALAAAAVAESRQAPLQDGASELPFMGGAVGFFGYDLVRTVEPLGPPNEDLLGLPDMALMLTDAVVAFDHLKHTITILANADLDAEPDLELAKQAATCTIAEVKECLAGPVPRANVGPREGPHFESNMTRERFEAMVERIVEYVYAGDAFQVVPSQRWSAEVPVEAFSIYRGLRTVNPSPYMYFLDFGDFQVAGASPEPLLTVSGRHVSTKPVAGTRPRGATPEDDRRIARELLADEKERAEHMMLVDLGRNDLGRVCEYGSVTVDELMEIEAYSHVMHIVSSVSGTLRKDVGALDE